MPLPAALVKVQILEVRNLSSALTAATGDAYLQATIHRHRTGRSMFLPPSVTVFNLRPEADNWTHEVPVSRGDTLSIELKLWDDRTDVAPAALKTESTTLPSPWTSRTFQFGNDLQISVQVTTRRLPGTGAQRAPVLRVPRGRTRRATLRPRHALLVELTEIQGLYKPVAPTAGASNTPAPTSSYVAGYTSDDDKGRIFINHDHNQTWTKDTQYIELTAHVHHVGGTLPADAKVKWTLVDPDDPFNDAPEVHRDWAQYLDANDFGARGRQSGATGTDNLGQPAQSPPWEAVSGHAMSGATATEVKTDIAGDVSKVRLHCPDVGGDNVKVRAEVETSSGVAKFHAETGTMTLWKRIRVQYLKMPSAQALPIRQMPAFFEPAYVQLDFDAEQVLGSDRIAVNDESTYVESVFSKKNQKGYFCLVSALQSGTTRQAQATGPTVRQMYPTPQANAPATQTVRQRPHAAGTIARGHHRESVRVPQYLTHAHALHLKWADSGGTDRDTTFFVRWRQLIRSGGRVTASKLWLWGHDIQHEFTAGDGTIDHAYEKRLWHFPQGRFRARDGGYNRSGPWTNGGYGVPNTAQVFVARVMRSTTAGVSPSVTTNAKDYFAGRTIAFTKHSSYWDHANNRSKPGFEDKVLAMIVHELGHAFGTPHKCGYWDFKTAPAGQRKSCSMNYNFVWLMDENLNMIPGSADSIGNHMCGRHLLAVRKVHLEDNRGLGWG